MKQDGTGTMRRDGVRARLDGAARYKTGRNDIKQNGTGRGEMAIATTEGGRRTDIEFEPRTVPLNFW